MKTLLIVNPSSGRGRTQKMLPQVRALLTDKNIEFVESRSQQDLIDLAAKATKEHYNVVAGVGGDGTIHYVLTGIYQATKEMASANTETQTALGILPLGRGNDIARSLGIPSDAEKACRILQAGKRRMIDLASTGKNVYIGVGGIGFDAEATRVANETKLHSQWLPATFVYTYAVLSVLAEFQPKEVRIVHDNGLFEGPIMMAAISNGQYYGAGMHITPIAEMDDNLLDICIVRKVSKPKLIANFPQVFKGAHLDNPHVTFFRSHRVEITTKEQMQLFGDGEYLEETPLKIEILPRVLPVIVP